MFLFVPGWNNGLREAVVSNLFLFLSTFFIQVLTSSYKHYFLVSTRLWLKAVYNLALCDCLGEELIDKTHTARAA